MPTLWNGIEALDNAVDAGIQTRMELVGRTIVERASRWLVNNRRPPIDIAKTIEQFRAGVAEVIESMPTLLVGHDLEQFEARRSMLLEQGFRKHWPSGCRPCRQGSQRCRLSR